MNYARTDPRRRGLHQESSPLNLAYDWSTPNSIKAKSIRSIALSGLQDLILYDLVITKPVGVVELTGSRAGTVNTVFLAVFSHDIRSNAASFRLDSDYAMETLGFPASMFAAVLQMVSLNNVYFRICSDAERNAVSTEASFAMSCRQDLKRWNPRSLQREMRLPAGAWPALLALLRGSEIRTQ